MNGPWTPEQWTQFEAALRRDLLAARSENDAWRKIARAAHDAVRFNLLLGCAR